MALLDDYMFSPSTYGGILPRWAQSQQQAQSAFDMPTSSYQFGGQMVPVFGQAPQGPEVSSQSRMPQQMPQQAPMQQPMQQPNRMQAGFEGFVENAHTGPMGALLGGIMGFSGGGSGNVTERALIARGLDKDTARAAVRNPALMQALVPQLFGARQTSLQMIDRPDGSGHKDPYLFDPGTGRISPVQLPASPNAQQQQPTTDNPLSAVAPAPAGLSKVAREAWDKKAAADAVDRVTNAPLAKTRARESIDSLFKTGEEATRLATHSGLEAASGPISSRLPTLRDNTANFETDLETLSTRIFINTINRMRELSKTGGAVGQVTEKEMAKLENSMKNLSLRQSDGNMRTNLRGVAKEINDSMASIAQAYKEQYGEDMPFQKLDAGEGELPRPKSVAEAAKLKPGTRFIDPSGKERIR